VDSESGAAKLIGPTFMPVLPFIPLSTTPRLGRMSTMRVIQRSRKALRELCCRRASPWRAATIVTAPALYEINPKTGHAKFIAPTDFGLASIVTVNDTVYALKAATGQVVTLDVATGQTSAVSDLDPAARLIGGATPARPDPEDRH